MEERQAEEKPTDTETSGRGEVKPEPRNSKLETRNSEPEERSSESLSSDTTVVK